MLDSMFLGVDFFSDPWFRDMLEVLRTISLLIIFHISWLFVMNQYA